MVKQKKQTLVKINNILLNVALKTWEVLSTSFQSVSVDGQTHGINAHIVYKNNNISTQLKTYINISYN